MACWDSGFESRWGHGCLVCVLYSKDKGTNQDRQSRQRNRHGKPTKREQEKEFRKQKQKKSRWWRHFLHPSRPALGPTSLLYSGYRLSPPCVKWPGRGAIHLPSSSAEVKERVELYLYSSSEPLWPVLGWNLLLGAYLTGFFAFVI